MNDILIDQVDENTREIAMLKKQLSDLISNNSLGGNNE